MESPGGHEIHLTPRACQKSLLPSQYGRPRLLEWKNNLSGLSHEYNLYFLASIDKILVFEPQFPSQELGPPKLKIKLPISLPGLPGHHTPEFPHAINQLLIDSLGNLEIIVVACDDGDVIAFYVKDVLRAIDNQVPKIQRDGHWVNGSGYLRPLLHEHVGKSAWGLAVHREARMLAVSANTREITIFSFALAGEEDRLSFKSNQSGCLFDCIGQTDRGVSFGSTFLHHRAISRRISLKSSLISANIPNISFCNTPEDPDGRFLASTNILGVTTIWDLRYKCNVEELVMRTRQRQATFEPWNVRMSGKHGGWNVAFLDKRSFRTVEPEDHATNNLFWDVNTEESEFEPWEGGKYDYDSDSEASSDEEAELLQGEESWSSNTNQLAPTTNHSSPLLSLFVKSRTLDHSDAVNERSQLWIPTLENCRAGILSRLSNSPILHTSVRDIFLLQPEYDTMGRTRLNCNEDGEPKPVHNRSITGLGPVMMFDASSKLPQPFCPIQTLHNPLKESVNFSTLIPLYERLNMVKEISELGVVVIGCAKGRVAIIQLIKRSKPKHQSEPGVDQASPRSTPRKRRRSLRESLYHDDGVMDDVEQVVNYLRDSDTGRQFEDCDVNDRNRQKQDQKIHITRSDDIFTFKLAHRIPLEEQERGGKRPPFPLIGIAVGPVQGSTRRWRIILTYLDGSILSYEICRGIDKGNSANGVSEVCV